jgi:hypothetical protein
VTARLLLVAAAMLAGSCGYHVGTRRDALPKKIRTIAIPAFDNLTSRYKLSERLPAAISREFITRTRYGVSGDVNTADAILRGSVLNLMAFPSIDPASGRSSAVQVSVVMQVSLTDRQTGAVLYTRPSMQFTQRYEISLDQRAYFEESDVALDRLSRDVARSIVGSILEAF